VREGRGWWCAGGGRERWGEDAGMGERGVRGREEDCGKDEGGCLRLAGWGVGSS
jgi:hypothetical protein